MKILILGGSGQTGSYLCDLYTSSGSEVYNASRNASPHPQNQAKFYKIEVDKKFEIRQLLIELNPDLVVNLLSLSSVYECERNPEISLEINTNFVEKCLVAISEVQEIIGSRIEFIQASSSEMYSGNLAGTVINEESELNPVTTYGKHKAMAHEKVMEYNSKCGGARAAILFNHESPRRPPKFVSKKIINGILDIKFGQIETLELGNIGARRDWGYAADYAAGIEILGSQSEHPALVFASGELHSVEAFLIQAAKTIGVANIMDKVTINQDLVRKVENDGLIGDSTKAKNLGWRHTQNFYSLIDLMASEELADRKNQMETR